MIVLGIESSCDETGLALYDSEQNRLLGHQLNSQISLHADYGGVVPELASRDHLVFIVPLLEKTLEKAKLQLTDIGAIAYTEGPGLGGCLLVGSGFAHGLAAALEIPLIAVHHLEGHLLSPFLEDKKPSIPFVSLLISGGHSQIYLVHTIGHYQLLGETLDDAAGEAFDKVGKLLDLSYPGGAKLSILAKKGHPEAYHFPRPMYHSCDLNMSFSGLKTAVLTEVRALQKKGPLTHTEKEDIAASFQAAIIDVLSHKTAMALEKTGLTRLVVAGGVGANEQLRQSLIQLPAEVYFPALQWCTDNGAMIALAGAMRLKEGKQEKSFRVRPLWPLSSLEKE